MNIICDERNQLILLLGLFVIFAILILNNSKKIYTCKKKKLN
jgi:hypothetical protein